MSRFVLQASDSCQPEEMQEIAVNEQEHCGTYRQTTEKENSIPPFKLLFPKQLRDYSIYSDILVEACEIDNNGTKGIYVSYGAEYYQQ